MKDLVKMFPDATSKRTPVDYGANDNEFGHTVSRNVVRIAAIALIFAVSIVVSAIIAYFNWMA